MSSGQWPEAWLGLTALYSARWNNNDHGSRELSQRRPVGEGDGYVKVPLQEPEPHSDSPGSDPKSAKDKRRLQRQAQRAPSLKRRESAMWEQVFFEEATKEARFEWVESARFQSVVGGAIGFNALIIGLETDCPSPVWYYVETGLLIFFLMEIVLRIARRGWAYFHTEEECFWNWLDFLIVVVGIVDQWLLPVLAWLSLINMDDFHPPSGHDKDKDSGSKMGKMGVTVLLLRIVRLLRILRLLRLVKVIRPLYHLSQGLIEAVQGMFWVLVVMTLGTYVVGILSTRLLGHGLLLNEETADPEALAMAGSDFATVSESMYMLFECMSGWTLLRFQPLFEVVPFLRIIFILFYVFSAWTLLAVMVGVVSENMIAIREQAQRDDEEKEEARRMRAKDTLVELFHRVDEDDSGTISKDEFDKLLQSTEEIAWLRENMKIRLGDLADLFDVLDEDGSGDVTVDEFIGGFRIMNEPLTNKSLMKLEQKLKADIKAVKPPQAALQLQAKDQNELEGTSSEELSGLSAAALNELSTKLDTVLKRLDSLHAGHHKNEEALVELTRITEEAFGGNIGVQRRNSLGLQQRNLAGWDL